MNKREALTASEVLHSLKLSEGLVRSHVIRPEHVRDATTGIEVDLLHGLGAAPPSGLFYRLDTQGFAKDLHALLSKCLVGYSMQLRRNGRTVLSEEWRWSKTPADGGVAWTADVPLHLASVSKLISAMAMTKLLSDRQLSPDTTISSWLPDYWRRGPNIDRITFRHLMTHTSGLNFVDDPTPSDFQFMKDQIAQGTQRLGQKKYQNMNFGLCRILISTLTGSVPTSATFHMLGLDLTDAFWDVSSINAYSRYVADNIFAPAGVSVPTLDHPAADALAYTSPAGSGWNSGDLRTMSGGVGWHMSVDDLLDVMGTFRRRGSIVSPSDARTMLDDEFGLDLTKDIPLGRMYAKGGYWSDSQGRTEQSNAFFLPKGMELVILANSPLCADGGFMYKVTDAIEANVHSTLLGLVVEAAAIFRRALWGLQRHRTRAATLHSRVDTMKR